MVRAYPIDPKGQQIGPIKSFSDMHWNKMVATFGKRLAFKQVPDFEPEKVKEIQLIEDVKEEKTEIVAEIKTPVIEETIELVAEEIKEVVSTKKAISKKEPFKKFTKKHK